MFIRTLNGQSYVVGEWFGIEKVMFSGTLSECIDWTNTHTYLGSEC